MTESLAHGYSYKSYLGESYPMNTNMTGFGWFSKIFASLCFEDLALEELIPGYAIKTLLSSPNVKETSKEFLGYSCGKSLEFLWKILGIPVENPWNS